MDRTVRLFTSHAEAKQFERAELIRMTPEQRLRIGAELHAFWVRNHYPDATRLDRVLRIAEHPSR